MFNFRMGQQSPKRIFKGSEQLFVENTVVINTNTKIVIPLNEKYDPYDFMLIDNLSSQDCQVIINQQHRSPLPRGVQSTVTAPNIRTLEIENIDSGTVSINEIQVHYRNTGHEGSRIINKGRGILEVVSNLTILRRLR